VARSELFDDHPGRRTGDLQAAPILVDPLGEDDSGQLVRNLLGDGDVPPELSRRIAEAAGGNPLMSRRSSPSCWTGGSCSDPPARSACHQA
jgi:hypothetical protein